MLVTTGDWIITGVKGEHYPCKPDIFEMTYEKADEDGVNTLYAMYEQACRQRDELMDIQRSMVEALRGRVQ